jgi:polyhydroxyalkanoate synthesis regulator phasin
VKNTNSAMETENKELLKKIAYLAIGIFSPESKGFSGMVEEWVEKGKMTEEEGRKFVEDLMVQAKTIKNDLEKSLYDQAKSFYDNMHLATTEQLTALEKRIEVLEKK